MKREELIRLSCIYNPLHITLCDGAIGTITRIASRVVTIQVDSEEVQCLLEDIRHIYEDMCMLKDRRV